MENGKEKEGWRFCTVVPGEQFATTIGINKTDKSFVVSLGSLGFWMLQEGPGLVREVAAYGWITCNASALKIP